MAKPGEVVETQGNVLIVRHGVEPLEHAYHRPGHGTIPGDYVLLHEDDTVEITGHRPEEPENIPVPGPQHDHS